MSVTYLQKKISESKRTDAPHYGRTSDGYTCRSGAPTSLLVRLEGETRWRRLMVWQWSNAGTLFVRVGGEPLVVGDHDVPESVG